MGYSITFTGPLCSQPRSYFERRTSREPPSPPGWRAGGDCLHPYDRFRTGRRESHTDARAPGARRRKRSAFGGRPLAVLGYAKGGPRYRLPHGFVGIAEVLVAMASKTEPSYYKAKPELVDVVRGLLKAKRG